MKKCYLILLLLFLFSCNKNETPFPRCISADDFSTLGMTIGANVGKGSDLFKDDNDKSSDGFNSKQVVRWQKTGLITTGEPLIIRTQGMWSAWLDDGSTAQTTSDKVDNKFSTQNKYNKVVKLSSISQERICGPFAEKDSGSICKNARKCPYIELNNPKDNKGAKNYGPPCWFRDGYGAYILLKRPDDKEPNATLDLMRNPSSPMVHIGYNRDQGKLSYSSIDHPFIDDSCKAINIEKGWEIYVKILDRFYWNNAGGYALEFLKGVTPKDKIRVLEKIRTMVQDILIEKGAKSIFKRLTTNNQFIDFVKSLLVLYIAFTGIAFMFGMVQQAYSDVVIRILKIAIIMQLISPYSWDFFYNNLAILFVEGTAQMIGVINSFAGGNFDPKQPFAVFDHMLDTLFSATVWKVKAQALLWANPAILSLFVLLIILIIICSYTIVMIYACIVYLTSIIGIAVLISILPLFLLTLLFSKIPITFDNWLKQAMRFSFQSIMVFTVVALFSAIIMNFYYRTFGFTTCYNTAFKMQFCLGSSLCIDIITIPSWTFGQKYDPYYIKAFDNSKDDMGEKNRSTFTSGVALIDLPPEYTKEGCRYIDYPFFDPQFKIDNKNCSKIDNDKFPDFSTAGEEPKIEGKGRDYEIIKKKIQGDEGYFLWEELFAMVLLIMLLFHIRLFAERIGASIAGSSPYISVIGAQYSNFFAPDHGTSSIFTKAGEFISGTVQGLQYKYTDIPSAIMRKIPGSQSSVAKAFGNVYDVLEWTVGGESDIKRSFREQEAFRSIHLAQAVIGQTLSNLSPSNLVKSGLSHEYDKLLGVTDKGIGESMLSAYRTQISKLKDNIYGRKEPEAPKSDTQEVDDENPFQSPQDADDKQRDGDSDYDNRSVDSPLYANAENLYEDIDDEKRSVDNPLYGRNESVYEVIDEDFLQAVQKEIQDGGGKLDSSVNNEPIYVEIGDQQGGRGVSGGTESFGAPPPTVGSENDYLSPVDAGVSQESHAVEGQSFDDHANTMQDFEQGRGVSGGTESFEAPPPTVGSESDYLSQ